MNGQAHIGHAELRFHAPVGQLHRAVHDAFGVHQHFDALRFDAEEPFGSIISKPLFIIVALSIVILAPISPVGGVSGRAPR